MLQRLGAVDRNRLALASIVLALVFFVCVNILSANLLKTARIDLTEEGLYTVTPGTKEILRTLEEPIRIRFYRSKQIDQLGPAFASHANRVGELLDEYGRLSGGMMQVEHYDPEPFSPEEDLAVADGLRGIVIDDKGTQIFLGLVGRNSTDDTKAIAYLAPERRNFLEYDLTSLIHDLNRPEKPVIAVLGGLPLRGDQFNRFQPWAIHDSMQESFEVRSLEGSIDAIAEDVQVVMLAQPGSLDEKTIYAVDQFIMRGGRVMAFIDPYTEATDRSRMGQPPAPSDAVAVAPLLEAWGIEIDGDTVIGDLRNSVQVRAPHQGRDVVTNYLPWLGLNETHFAAEDVVTGNLRQLNLRSSGAIAKREGAEITVEPLVRSSELAMQIDADRVRFAPDPVGLLNEFQGAGRPFTLAARVTGPIKSAFPDGPPESVTDEAIREAHLSEAAAPLNAIVVADADILADQNWIQSGNLLGQSFSVPIANNGDFTINALDNLSGSRGLIELRGRGLPLRPFVVLEVMARQAEERFRSKEQDLLTKIAETQDKMQELQRQEQEAGIILSAEQQATIDDFRDEMILMRRELRDVQLALRQDVERLQSLLRALNIWAVPLLVGLVACVLAYLRRRRAFRFEESVHHAQ